MKVLIADDDPEILKMLSIGLQVAGHNVSTARDAMQALMFARKQSPDVVLLDITMPGGNGLEVLKLLKQSPATKKTVVIIISASADAEMPQKVKAMGAADYIAKPFDVTKIVEALAKCASS